MSPSSSYASFGLIAAPPSLTRQLHRLQSSRSLIYQQYGQLELRIILLQLWLRVQSPRRRLSLDLPLCRH